MCERPPTTQKIDDTLRMVIAGSPAQTQQIVAYLDDRQAQGHLAYGVHVSDRALMTC
jgi:20S proteasome alpha/beta subunit